MRVLLIGSGAREHTIAWKLLQSSGLTKLFVAPGNAGTDLIATNIPLVIPELGASLEEWEKFNNDVVAICRKHRIDFVVLGPEAPSAFGLVNHLNDKGIRVFGPTQEAAEIESSKIWAHEFMSRHAIPQPAGQGFSSLKDARRWISGRGSCVIKKDGLAAGKGVKTAYTLSEANRALKEFFADGRSVLIQELLLGKEISAHAFTDGHDIAHMPFSCDYKKIGEGDTGENTGGIGAYSPVVWLDPELSGQINHGITANAVQGLAAEGSPFVGAMYPGLMITDSGPKVLEFNCRFGDPEAQVLLPRLQGDLLDIMSACVNPEKDLLKVPVEWDSRACVCVVLCSGGYPDDYETGFPITGLDKVPDDILIFHAGTRTGEEGQILTAGGRVLSVAALGETLEEARRKVYAAVSRIYFKGMYYRPDIALV